MSPSLSVSPRALAPPFTTATSTSVHHAADASDIGTSTNDAFTGASVAVASVAADASTDVAPALAAIAGPSPAGVATVSGGTSAGGTSWHAANAKKGASASDPTSEAFRHAFMGRPS